MSKTSIKILLTTFIFGVAIGFTNCGQTGGGPLIIPSNGSTNTGQNLPAPPNSGPSAPNPVSNPSCSLNANPNSSSFVQNQSATFQISIVNPPNENLEACLVETSPNGSIVVCSNPQSISAAALYSSSLNFSQTGQYIVYGIVVSPGYNASSLSSIAPNIVCDTSAFNPKLDITVTAAAPQNSSDLSITSVAAIGLDSSEYYHLTVQGTFGADATSANVTCAGSQVPASIASSSPSSIDVALNSTNINNIQPGMIGAYNGCSIILVDSSGASNAENFTLAPSVNVNGVVFSELDPNNSNMNIYSAYGYFGAQNSYYIHYQCNDPNTGALVDASNYNYGNNQNQTVVLYSGPNLVNFDIPVADSQLSCLIWIYSGHAESQASGRFITQ